MSSDFGKELKTARISAQLTQQNLGEAIGKSKIFISQLENGYCLPTKEDFEKIKSILQKRIEKINLTQVITRKTRVITDTNSNSSAIPYVVHINALRSDFPLLTKNNINRAGFKGLRGVFMEGYQQLRSRLLQLERTFVNGKPAQSFNQFEKMFEDERKGKIFVFSNIVENCYYFFTVTK